ncbi:MAG: Gldg family protein [Rikenellaceae bacterium]
MGLTYATELDTYIHTQAMGYDLYGATAGLFAMGKGIFPAITQYLYLYIPLITMGLMSKEYSTGSIKLLYSSPIKNSSIVLGKFLSMMIYGFALIAVILIYYIFSLIIVVNVDWQSVLSGLLGIYLLLCVYSAIGLFMSTLTSYQVVVAVGTLMVLGFLNYVGGMGQDIAFVRDITYWLSLTGRVQDMIGGLICSEDVIYFLTIIFLFLTLSTLLLESQRVSNNRKKISFKLIGLFVIVIAIGYVTSRPVYRFYVDTTYTQKNTLAQQSIEVIKKMEGALRITSYVNVFGEDSYLGLPRYIKADVDFFERYLRFKPEIELDYVYYFIDEKNRKYEDYPGKNSREVAEIFCKRLGINPKQLVSYDEVAKTIDLSNEGFNYVRVIENGAGVKSFLRVYDDKEKVPREGEITVAMKRLIHKSPIVGFVQGHTDREIELSGGRGFNMFSIKKSFRNALVNQGFDAYSINLAQQEIPEEVSILVIADLKTPLSEIEKEKVQNYIQKGGNLYILADKDRHDNMNAVTAPLGITFEKGLLVEPVRDLDPSLIAARITKEGIKLIPPFADAREYVMIMPTTLGINYENVKDFQTTVLVSTSKEAWSEKVTTDFIENVPECLENEGEKKQEYATVLAMSRKINNKEQRIIISGDADCVADQEFMTYRPYNKANFSLISCPFMWLSEDQFPIVPMRPDPIDNKVTIPLGARSFTKMAGTALPAAILLVLGLFIIIIRQKG